MKTPVVMHVVVKLTAFTSRERPSTQQRLHMKRYPMVLVARFPAMPAQPRLRLDLEVAARARASEFQIDTEQCMTKRRLTRSS